MHHREAFFSVLEGNRPERMPFVPDITDWYIGNKTPAGQEREYWAGQLIPDNAAIHATLGSLPEKYRGFTLLDFYRRFDWGFHTHIYDWFDVECEGPVERVVEKAGNQMVIRLHTPRGDLVRREQLAEDGTWCVKEHFVKDVGELEILSRAVEAMRFLPRFDKVRAVLDEIGTQGQVDLVIPRSPFGKLVQEFMGFERTAYALFDASQTVKDFLHLQEQKDLELIRLACAAPARLVIISDHADENLISPRLYADLCVPFYARATRLLHEANKFVSTHLDGNIKGHFPLLGQTGFDYLDGCTPAPMFNYEIEELAEALPKGMCAFCGVPSALFCQEVPMETILSYAERIVTALRGRGFLNVGDILPPNGDIEQVVAVGEYVKRI